MPLEGLRVVAFESRRTNELAELIRRQGGDAVVAPSMREATIEQNEDAFAFAEQLFAGEFDMMVLLTGVGTRALNQLLATHYAPEKFANALRRITTVARGPKPAAALREMGVAVDVFVPEPNTWREVLSSIEARPERCIGVQEYGRSNAELLDGLRKLGAHVRPVRVYRYELPEDVEPLRQAVRGIVRGDFQVALFTTSVQVEHVSRIAAQLGVEHELLAALRGMVVAAIGPTTAEALEEFGIQPDFMPSHPKMGFLVKETAEQARTILDGKRAMHA